MFGFHFFPCSRFDVGNFILTENIYSTQLSNYNAQSAILYKVLWFIFCRVCGCVFTQFYRCTFHYSFTSLRNYLFTRLVDAQFHSHPCELKVQTSVSGWPICGNAIRLYITSILVIFALKSNKMRMPPVLMCL